MTTHASLAGSCYDLRETLENQIVNDMFHHQKERSCVDETHTGIQVTLQLIPYQDQHGETLQQCWFHTFFTTARTLACFARSLAHRHVVTVDEVTNHQRNTPHIITTAVPVIRRQPGQLYVMINVSLRSRNAPNVAHPWTSPDLVTRGRADPHALRQRSHQSAPYIPHCSMNTRVLESLLVAIADEP